MQLYSIFNGFLINVAQILWLQLKERAEKLEYHKMRENKSMEKKKEKTELLRRQSSIWIDEPQLEGKILEAIVASTI